MMKKRVLFLCTGNSARSQIAEALLKHKAGHYFDVYSAGTHPEPIDARAIAALAIIGLNGEALTSQHIDEYSSQQFDYVITLCDLANAECLDYSGARYQLAWNFPDPKIRTGDIPFVQTLHEINQRLTLFVTVELAEMLPITQQKTYQATVEPTLFYKALTDEIRLKTLMLAHYHGELCVCELMAGLSEQSQPKVSRNLAVLKKANIITDRKHGQWVFYQINPQLPLWAKSVIAQTTENNISLIKLPLQRLAKMNNRPNKSRFCV